MGVQPEEEKSTNASKSSQKTSKDVHFCLLPDKYEPLVEEQDEEEPEEKRRRKEEKKRKKKIRYKKYRKNVGKALRFSWRCLVAGLQSMVPVYSGPMAAAASVVTNVDLSNGHKA